jgi:hypothetical protein
MILGLSNRFKHYSSRSRLLTNRIYIFTCSLILYLISGESYTIKSHIHYMNHIYIIVLKYMLAMKAIQENCINAKCNLILWQPEESIHAYSTTELRCFKVDMVMLGCIAWGLQTGTALLVNCNLRSCLLEFRALKIRSLHPPLLVEIGSLNRCSAMRFGC